jgi:hypothetical protein
MYVSWNGMWWKEALKWSTKANYQNCINIAIFVLFRIPQTVAVSCCSNKMRIIICVDWPKCKLWIRKWSFPNTILTHLWSARSVECDWKVIELKVYILVNTLIFRWQNPWICVLEQGIYLSRIDFDQRKGQCCWIVQNSSQTRTRTWISCKFVSNKKLHLIKFRSVDVLGLTETTAMFFWTYSYDH